MGALRYLQFIVPIVILVYCLIDCIQTDSASVRNLDKSLWVILIIFLPIVGGVAWLVAGRPQGGPRRQVPWPSTGTAGFPESERPRRRSVAPDDDPAFLAGLRAEQTEHERMLAQWEAQLREREERLRAEAGAPTDADAGPIGQAPGPAADGDGPVAEPEEPQR